MKLDGRLLLLTALVSSASGCDRKPPPGPAVAPIRADTAPAPTLATASAGATPSPIAPEAPGARLADAPLPLAVFHVSQYEPAPAFAEPPSADDAKMRVFDVGGRMVVAPMFNGPADGKLGDDSPVGFEPDDFPGGDYRGNPTGANWLRVKSIAGSYPEDLWVEAHGTWGYVAPRAGYPVPGDYVWQRQYGHWGRVKEAPVGAAAWSHGRTLAYLELSHFALAHPQKGKLGELPQQAELGGHARVEVRAMTALRSGEVVVAGVDAADGGHLAIEAWDGDSGDALHTSRVVPLPASEAAAPNRTWLFASKARVLVVASYGDHVFAAEIPAGEPPRRLALPIAHVAEACVAADGTLFVASDTEVFRHEGSGAFARGAAPLPIKEITGLFAEARDRAYVSVLNDVGQSLLLWTGEAKEPLPAPPPPPAAGAPSGSVATAEKLLATFPVLAPGCATPFVVFFPVSSATGHDFAFPQTRATLADFAARSKLGVVDFRAGGRRYVGATAPDVETATALSVHWNARDAKSPSRPACFAPPAEARVLTLR